MTDQSSNAPDRNHIKAVLSELLRQLKVSRISLAEFKRITKISERQIFKHFDSWVEALQLAGATSPTWRSPITEADLFLSVARVCRRLGRFPTTREYVAAENAHGATTIRRKLGSWAQVASRLKAFIQGNETIRQDYEDVLSLIPDDTAPVVSRPIEPHVPFVPTNEMGVIFLFGRIAEQLGFRNILFNSRGFPDATGQRIQSSGNLKQQRIEFEFRSRNFQRHGHQSRNCDLIICWEDNWPERPRNLRLLELKSVAQVN